jgi:aminopeptidase
MLSDTQLDRYADVLLWALKKSRTEKFKRGDIILIRSDPAAARLAERVQAKVLEGGMHAVVRMGLTSEMERTFFTKANNKQLVFEPPGDKEFYSHLDGSIYLHAPESLTHLGDVDPRKIAKTALARKPLRDILDKREAKGRFGWTLCMMPTPELARHAGLTLRQYTNQIVKACLLDTENPSQAWQEIYRKALRIRKWLSRMEVAYLHIESKSIDLKITPGKQRKWIGLSGHNIPSFEIFVSPDWRGTEGIYFADLPSFRSGNLLEGVRLEFKKGNVARVEARKGVDFVRKQIAMDRGASRVGEFSLTDKRFSRINKFMANTLFDENHGGRYGNCHLALGSSFADTYSGDPGKLTKKKKEELGFNDSALHWDLVNKEKKTVTAHLTSGAKVLIYENGHFKSGEK